MKFGSNIDLRKQDFLRQGKISEYVTYFDQLYLQRTKIALNMFSLFTFVKKRER